MSENEATVAEQGTETEQEQEFLYPVKVEDAGPAAKKVSVEIPRDRIVSKLDEQYKELRGQAAIPGFRIGHAPRKLLEKRFSQSVKDQVASTLIRESYEQALKKNDLKVIGEPEFDSQEQIKLPDDGPLNYSFSVEVQPNIAIPDFANLKVKKPKITITEANIDQAMQNLREQQGTLVPVEDRGVETGDYLTADVHIKVDGNVVGHTHDGQIVARAGRIGGLQVDDLDKQLAGASGGETRTITVKAPDTHPTEALRGKDVQIEVGIKDIKRLELAELNETFLEDLGFENQQELRDALREQMDEKINFDIQQAMREQVSRFLLENTQVDLPNKMSTQQADRVVQRRAIDLLQRGMPREQVEANVEKLRAGAQDEAVRELKLFFILQKIAGDMDVDVSEGELNGRVAMLAAQRDQRPEKLKQTMTADGSLQNLYVQMREQKAVDQILTKAQVEEIEMTPQQGEAAAAPAASDAPADESAAQ
ncbi:MAG TPA: trigger factor [Tepidisphaeraceae bacterium]|jgi:trigger factor|nr:trigger factor [Tepidisphaeraceae bacterium]